MDFGHFMVLLTAHAPKAKWELEYDALGQTYCIRTKDGFCPICFVAKMMGLNPEDFKIEGFSAGIRLEISDPMATAIMNAADGVAYDDNSKYMRDRMLSACGLAERVPEPR